MSYCLNPACQEPENLDSAASCQACGTPLWLNDRYRPVKLLGQGGFGRTFLAIDQKAEPANSTPSVHPSAILPAPEPGSDRPSPGMKCVIKQLLPQQLATRQQSAELFQQEITRLADLGNHPQIPTLLDSFTSAVTGQDLLYLIQEWIDGISLTEVLRQQGCFSEAQIWQLLADLLPVLKFVHDRHVIHRDIKPDNILRRYADNQLVLVDFGAAKLLKETASLQPGTRIGSPEFVAPEQARGKATYASDLYSLGVTCIYLLTQVPPFDLFDTANDRWAWQDYLPPGQPVSDRLANLLNQLIENAGNQRFQTVVQVMQQVQKTTINWQQATASSTSRFSRLSHPCRYTLAEAAGLSTPVNAVAISPNGQLVAGAGEDGTIRFWDFATGTARFNLTGHTQPVRSLSFHPNGITLASAGDDKTVRLWDLSSQQPLTVPIRHTRPVRAIAFSASGDILVSASWDKTLQVWRVGTAEVYITDTGFQLSAIALSVDRQFLATANLNRTVRLWRIPPAESTSVAPQLHRSFTDHTRPVAAVALSPTEPILASGSDDNTIKLWHVSTGEVLHTLNGHSWSVAAIAVLPDGKTLASGSRDRTIKCWEL